MHCPINSKWIKIISVLFVTLVIVIAVLVVVFLPNKVKGSVVTNGHGCAHIGRTILENDGSAVDAAIAALFCEGVSMPHSMGLGGGFLMTIYDSKTGKVQSLTAREVAPKAADQDMFHGNSTLSQRGGLSVAVPGELRGYWYAYRAYGKLPWKDLVQPTIDLCENGILVTNYLASVFLSRESLLKSDEGLRQVFIDPDTNKPYREGEYIKRKKLAATLKIIADEGGDALHNGSLTEDFANDVRKLNGIITADDLRNYKPTWQTPITVNLPGEQTLYSSPLPGSGVILAYILNLLHNFLDKSQPDSVTNWQRIVESFKFGYGQRTELGDIDTIGDLVKNLTSIAYADEIRKLIQDNKTFSKPEHYGAKSVQIVDHGTANVAVLAPNGDAIAVTSTINFVFGSGLTSPSTGIILNDEMDDFSSPGMDNGFNLPPSPSNFIAPGKRPMSSMCPTIIIDQKQNKVRMVTGAAGGTKITTSVALIIIKHLWYERKLQDAMDDKRLHHQLLPMLIEFEDEFKEDMTLVNELAHIGHNYTLSSDNGFAAVTSISNDDSGYITGTYDRRRPGDVAYIY